MWHTDPYRPTSSPVINDKNTSILTLWIKSVCRVVDTGIDVTANQDDEMSDKETFQIEFDTKKDQWRIRTADNLYWKVADASGIQATDDGRSVTCINEISINKLMSTVVSSSPFCSLSVAFWFFSSFFVNLVIPLKGRDVNWLHFAIQV